MELKGNIEMNAEELKGLYQDYVMPTYNFGTVMAKGSGSHVWDVDGNEYFDLTMGINYHNITAKQRI